MVKNGLRLRVLALILAAHAAGASDEKPIAVYRHGGGLSSYGTLVVEVYPSGHARAEVTKQKSAVRYEATLSREELSALQALVGATEFFSQPDKDSQFATDTGRTEISIVEPDRERTVRFAYRPSLDPLCVFFYKFIKEAEAFHALEQSEGSLRDVAAPDRTLQPQRLKEPRMRHALQQSDPHKAQAEMEALAAWLTPEELLGLMHEKQASNPVGSAFLIFPGEPHRQLFDAVYLQYLREHYPRLDESSPWEKELFSRSLGALVEARYAPAVPVLVGWLEDGGNLDFGGPWNMLPAFGERAVLALLPELENQNAPQRRQASELLGRTAHLNPLGAVSHPADESEWARMKELFAQKVLPKLQALIARDPSQEVRTAAGKAKQEIESEMNRQPLASVPPIPSPTPIPPLPPYRGPFITVSVDGDHNLSRSLATPEPQAIDWVVYRDGQLVLMRNAVGETQFRFPEELPGLYTIWVTGFVEGAYRVISNVVFYRVEREH